MWVKSSNGHDQRLIFKPRPCQLPALDKVDCNGGGAGVLNRSAAHLPVALAGVSVTDKKPSASAAHWQVSDAARPHVGQVHVAAVVVGR